MNPSMIGIWVLISSLTVESDIPFVGQEPETDGVNTWLYGNSNELLGQASPTPGLTLRIEPNGVFSEERTDNLKLSWFDEEGVLTETVAPFGGIVNTEGALSYLVLAAPISWATPIEPLRKARVRYDDNDTVICDKLEVIDGQLIRTMSVVTDELYLNRTVLIYRRA